MVRLKFRTSFAAVILLGTAMTVTSSAAASGPGFLAADGTFSYDYEAGSLQCHESWPIGIVAAFDGTALVHFKAYIIPPAVFLGQIAGAEGDGATARYYAPTACVSPVTPFQGVALVTSYSFDCASRSLEIQLLHTLWSGNEAHVTISASSSSSSSGMCADTCFAYNPSALTNACVTTADTPVEVPVPTVGTTPTTVDVPTVTPTFTPTEVCIIGPVCATVPVPGAEEGSTPVEVPVPSVGSDPQTFPVPTPTGYVEVTALCGFDVPCGHTF